jgi:hypothetical protein
MDQDSTPTLSSSLNRRRVLAGTAGIGAAALLGAKLVQAQDSTATPGAGTSTTEETDEQTYYDNFVSKLAANLGISDSATVDKAIRNSLTQIVDEELAGGHISQDTANKLKENIASGDVPFLFPGRHGRRGMGRGQGGKDETEDQNGTDDSTDATPTTSA